FDLLRACQGLEFDRAAGLKSIPVRFGVRDSLRLSRLMHAAAVLFLAALAMVTDLGPLYLAGVALVALLLVYEQSLVSEDDLSQVKRAFDLNGYVGILYFAATAVSIYARSGRHVRSCDHRRQRRALRGADDGGAAGEGVPPGSGDLGLRTAAAAR